MDAPSAPEMPATADSPPDTIVERWIVMILHFCGRSLHTLGCLLVNPGGVMQRAASGDSRLAPPFCFATAALFIAGIAFRIWILRDDGGGTAPLLDQLRDSMSSIDLANAILMTLPCVLWIAAMGWMLARIARCRAPFTASPVVRGVCYGVGLQFFVLAGVAFAVMALAALLGNPRWVSQSMFNTLYLPLLAGTVAWAAVAIGHAILLTGRGSSFRRAAVCLVGGAVVASAGLVGCLLAMAMSFNFQQAWDASYAQLAADVHDGLNPVILAHRHEPATQDGPDRLHLTLALTNCSQHRQIVPRHDLLPTGDGRYQLSVEATSLDGLDDPAWILDPGQTRVARLVLAMPASATVTTGTGSTRLLFPFYIASDAEFFRPTNTAMTLPVAIDSTLDNGISDGAPRHALRPQVMRH